MLKIWNAIAGGAGETPDTSVVVGFVGQTPFVVPAIASPDSAVVFPKAAAVFVPIMKGEIPYVAE